MPIMSVNSFFYSFSYMRSLREIALTLRYNVFFLLFCVSTLAFIIKKNVPNLSMAIILSASAGLVIIFANGPLLNVIMGRQATVARVGVTIDTWFFVATYALLTTLFWKKGFEVALLCSMIITTILYFIAPLLLNAPHINIHV